MEDRFGRNAERNTGQLQELPSMAERVGRNIVPLALMAIPLRRWVQMGGNPPGVDEGHWLAFGKAYLLAGSDIERLYSPLIMPPAVPVLLQLLRLVIGPFEAARLTAAMSIAAVSLAVYFVSSRSAGPWFAGLSATLLASSILVIDPVAWGGYPQNFALASVVISGYLTAVFLGSDTRGKRQAIPLLAISLLASLTHHAFYGVLILVSLVVAGVWLLGRRPMVTRARLVTLAGCFLCFLPSLAWFGVVLHALKSASYDPAVNAGGSSISGTLAYLTPSPSPLWWLLGFSGLVGILVTVRNRARPEWQVAAALATVGTVAFLVTVEPRFLSVAASGMSLGLALGLREALSRTQAGVLSGAIPALGAFVLFAVLPPSDSRATDAFDWFRVISPNYVAAAAWINDQPDAGAVAMRTDSRGWPVGWWMRGLTDKTIMVGSDVRWLGFPQEKQEARLVAQLFEPGRSPDEVAQMADDYGVGWLVFRTDQWLGWNSWLEGRTDLVVAYRNPEYTIVKVSRDTPHDAVGN